VHEGSKIKDLIVDLQNEMKAGPSNWLAKAINQNKVPIPSVLTRWKMRVGMNSVGYAVRTFP